MLAQEKERLIVEFIVANPGHVMTFDKNGHVSLRKAKTPTPWLIARHSEKSGRNRLALSIYSHDEKKVGSYWFSNEDMFRATINQAFAYLQRLHRQNGDWKWGTDQ
jgi:hypothetical protein